MSEGVLGIDLGTTRVKVGVFGIDGAPIASAHRAYGLIEPGPPGWFEQDPEEWWGASRDAIREVVGASLGTRIVGLCVVGQGPSIVAVDDRGAAVANALIWMDRRCEAERARLAARLGGDVSEYSAVPKASWLRRERPEAYARTRWFLQAWDYIAFRLTGTAVSSSFRGGVVFPSELVAAAELAAERFPPQLVMGGAGGTLRPAVARELGLPVADLPVAGGVNDSTASVLGIGILRRGLALDLGGTSGGLGLAWDAPLAGPGLTTWPLPKPGLFICGGPLAAAGTSFKWLLTTFGYGAAGAETAFAEAASVPSGAAGLVFLPYLAGERTPLWDDQARGVLFGLGARHTRAHVARAVLEGVAFALRHIAESLRDAGGTIDELRVSGGQAKGALWNQIKADVLGTTVAVPSLTEGALLGAAILAATGAGRTADPLAAADRFVRIVDRLEPRLAAGAVYAERYATYRQLYPRLRDLMADGGRGGAGGREAAPID